MRKRSGGLHCNSEEELIKMANLLQDGVGLFYDERNETLIRHFEDLSLEQGGNSGSHPLSKQKKDKYMFFENFDYDKEKEEELRYQQQQEHEQKQMEKKLKKVEIAVISSVSKASDMKNSEDVEGQKFFLRDNQSKILNLYLQKKTIDKQSFIFCYWIVNKEHTSSPIVRVYLEKAEKIFNISEEEVEVEEELAGKLRKCKAGQVEGEVQKLFIF